MDADLIPDYRRAIRGHLADRAVVSQCAETIARHFQREYRPTTDETEHALTFLTALGHLAAEPDPLGGARKYYRATAAGILAHERGE
jgi:hypothetical protein